MGKFKYVSKHYKMNEHWEQFLHTIKPTLNNCHIRNCIDCLEVSLLAINLAAQARILLIPIRGKYHYTADLLFYWFGPGSFRYLYWNYQQNYLIGSIPNSKTGGQLYIAVILFPNEVCEYSLPFVSDKLWKEPNFFLFLSQLLAAQSLKNILKYSQESKKMKICLKP